MSTWPRLSKAPIVEGLIDIRVERSADASIGGIKTACEELAADFPSRRDTNRVVAQIVISSERANRSLTTDEAPSGVMLRSADEKWVVQFGLDGFTVSRLQPYGTWEELRAKATELWAKYAEITKPARILRVASRFVNRVQLPPGEPFEKTFLTNFVIGPTLPQVVAGFLLRVVIPFEDKNAIAIVTQSLDGNSADCIFDLDTFSELPKGFDESELWTKLDDLREVKNRIFFGSFTDEALERFK